MALENARLYAGNITTDRDNLYVASFDHSLQAIVEKNKSSGAVVFAWPTDTVFTEVFSAEFDGYYWWSLERQEPSGFTVRKWKKEANVFAKNMATFSYSSSGYTQYSSRSFAVEWYSTTVSTSAGPGVGSLDVSSTDNIRLGDTIVIGPSSAGGYSGNYEEVQVIGVSPTTVFFSAPLANRFSSSDKLYWTRAVWVFNDYGDADNTGSLVKLLPTTGSISLIDYSALYKNVDASTFYSGKVLGVKGNSVYWINPSSVQLDKVMSIDNLKSDRSSTSTVYDLYGYGDFIYRLQTEVAYFSSGIWNQETWSTYNTVSSKAVPEVYMISLVPDKRKMHIISPPVVTTASSTIHCTVYDQFNIPVSGKTVDFTTTAGTVSPLQAVTDSNGYCETHYSGDTQVTLVKITATTI